MPTSYAPPTPTNGTGHGLHHLLKRAGGGGGGGGLHQDFLEIDFLVVSDRESNSYQNLFTKLKNIALGLKYCWSNVSAVV